MCIEDIWEEFPPGGCVGSDLRPMTVERMEEMIINSRLQKQIERAQEEISTWSPERLKNIQLEGSGPYDN